MGQKDPIGVQRNEISRERGNTSTTLISEATCPKNILLMMIGTV